MSEKVQYNREVLYLQPLEYRKQDRIRPIDIYFRGTATNLNTLSPRCTLSGVRTEHFTP